MVGNWDSCWACEKVDPGVGSNLKT
ncbi:Protein of unknown function [Pyronema omphalodes CBS 100304]|uniref:Uncharacterized protein n=1 Tax=Pyronema omphalodes (strain CBS 100304) TaxID=1076935 RepID=U4LL84_PYROM|nr:Protein of unknown function [Pyronema omphalodes CBS 100304]